MPIAMALAPSRGGLFIREAADRKCGCQLRFADPDHGVMNVNFVPKSFSTYELVAGSAALAPVALIAFFGLRVPQSQNPLPAVPSSLSSAAVLLSQSVSWPYGEQFSERSQNAGVTRKPLPVGPGSEPDNLNLPEPDGPTATGSPAAEGRTGSSARDRAAEAALAPPAPLEQNPPNRRSGGEDAFVGGWADDTDECRQYQNHGAPLVISTRAAKTGDGKCDFQFIRREAASRWRVVALCSREGETWTAHVALTVAGSNLIWSSERGVARYVRCLRP